MTRSEFLTNLQGELETGESARVSTGVAPQQRKAGKYAFAAVVALLSPMLSLSPSPATAASTCYSPNYTAQSHTKTCSNPMSWARHEYKRTTYDGAKTVCYHFSSAAHNVCGSGNVYPIGNTQACKSY